MIILIFFGSYLRISQPPNHLLIIIMAKLTIQRIRRTGKLKGDDSSRDTLLLTQFDFMDVYYMITTSMKVISSKNKKNNRTGSSHLYHDVVLAQKQVFSFIFIGCLVLLIVFILGVSQPGQANATREETIDGAQKATEDMLKNRNKPNSGNNNNNSSGGNNGSNNNGGGAIPADKNNQGNNNQNNNQNQGNNNNQNQNQNGGNNNSNGGSNGGGGGSGGGGTCGSAHTFFDWGCNGASDKDSILTVLVTISNWLAAGVVIAVIGGIIYGAIMYATSAGDAGKAKSATEIIRNAFIALVLYFLMWAFLQYIVPGGLFG